MSGAGRWLRWAIRERWDIELRITHPKKCVSLPGGRPLNPSASVADEDFGTDPSFDASRCGDELIKCEISSMTFFRQNGLSTRTATKASDNYLYLTADYLQAYLRRGSPEGSSLGPCSRQTLDRIAPDLVPSSISPRHTRPRPSNSRCWLG